ncbi:hypothetical protein SLA2020_181550 [Shorea laevis]
MRNLSGFYSKAKTSIEPQLIKLNSQLADLTRSTHYEDALYLFDEIRSLHFHLKPDQYTLSTTLTACAKLRDVAFGNKLHAYAIRAGYKAYSHVSNTLLSLYAKGQDLVSVKRVFEEIENPDVYSWTTLLSSWTKLGDVGFACEVFDRMPEKDVAVWNAMITGCVENGYEKIGIDLFKEMHSLGFRHDNYSFASVLSLCSWEMVDFGRQIHSLVVKSGFLVRASVVNALITMYFNCEDGVGACSVFEQVETSVRDQITFNVMIDGFINMGRVEEGFIKFSEMLQDGISPTELTFVSLMSSCSCPRIGCQVYAQAIKIGFEGCTSVSNAAVTMYSSFGDLSAAQMIFHRLEEKDLVSWNAMISSYVQVNSGRSAILAYVEMQRAGIKPDEFTFGSLLSSSEFVEITKMIQGLVLKNGVISKIQVSNALVSAYSKHGKIKQAYHLFQMSPKNLISWNTIISGFLLNGFPIQGLEQFAELLMSELKPDAYTLSIALSICASLSSLTHGRKIHSYILRHNFFSETSLGNSLITMYAKCGVLNWTSRVFSKMINKDIVSWNALISAYAQHGEGKEAIGCFEAMKDANGIVPDQATFTAVLSACSHAGLVNEGTWIFNSMVKDYGVVPGEDHLSCMVDLLGRAGHLEEAERILNSQHSEAHSNVWWTLFSACAAQGNLRLGRIVAGFLLETEEENPSVYVLLSNIYAAAGQWEEAAKVREMMKNIGVMKDPGSSWISS